MPLDIEDFPRMSMLYDVTFIGETSTTTMDEHTEKAAKATLANRTKQLGSFDSFLETYVKPTKSSEATKAPLQRTTGAWTWDDNTPLITTPAKPKTTQPTLFNEADEVVDGLVLAAESDFLSADSMYKIEDVYNYLEDRINEAVEDAVPSTIGGMRFDGLNIYTKIAYIVSRMEIADINTVVSGAIDNYGMEILEVKGGFPSLMKDMATLLERTSKHHEAWSWLINGDSLAPVKAMIDNLQKEFITLSTMQ